MKKKSKKFYSQFLLRLGENSEMMSMMNHTKSENQFSLMNDLLSQKHPT